MMRNTKTLSALLAGAIVSVTAASIVYAQTKVPPLAPLGDPPIPLDNPMSEAKTKIGRAHV